MINHSSFIAILSLFVLMAAIPSRASIIMTGSTAITMTSQSSASGSTNTTTIKAGLGYEISNRWEAIVLYDSVTSGTSSSTYQIQVPFLLTGTHNNALYLGPVYGAGSAPNSTTYGLVFGKRFEFAGPVTWDPNIVATVPATSTGSGTYPLYTLNVVQFTILF